MKGNGNGNGTVNGEKGFRQLTEAHLKQIAILKMLSTDVKNPTHPKQYDLSTIAQRSGFEEKEVLRDLYIMEGHKLVSPHPAGDFTSKMWYITEDGMRAVKVLQKDMVL